MALHTASTDEYVLVHDGSELIQCLFLAAGEAVETIHPHLEAFPTYTAMEARASALGLPAYDPTQQEAEP